MSKDYNFWLGPGYAIGTLGPMKLLPNLALGESLPLVKKLPFFDDPIELYVLLAGAFHLCIHDSINYKFIKAVRVEFYRGKFSATSEVSNIGIKYG
jgi:hypothetical protein